MKRLFWLILAALVLLGYATCIQSRRHRELGDEIAIERAERTRLIGEMVAERFQHQRLTDDLAQLYFTEITKARVESRSLRIYVGSNGPNPEMKTMDDRRSD